MSEEREQRILEALREICDRQRAILEALNRQKDLAQDQYNLVSKLGESASFYFAMITIYAAIFLVVGALLLMVVRYF